MTTGELIYRARQLAALREQATSGPWHSDEVIQQFSYRIVGSGWTVARCEAMNGTANQANAKLIAAAPEMAELLEEMASALARHSGA